MSAKFPRGGGAGPFLARSLNCFIINLHESMGPDRDRTRNPWICSQTSICSQTRYPLRYAARQSSPLNGDKSTIRMLIKRRPPQFSGFIENKYIHEHALIKNYIF